MIFAILNNSFSAERLSTLSTSNPIFVSCSKRFFSFKFFSFPKPDAARSLAIPLKPRQSDLLGVIDKSIRFEFDFEK